MITFKLGKDGAIELADKKGSVKFSGREIFLDDKSYDGPGEYEADGIEIIRGENGALIVWEQLQIAYIFSLNAPTTFERSQFASCDVLVFSSKLEEITKSNSLPIIDEYDPKVLIIPAIAKIETSFEGGLKLQESNSIKLASTSLPEEGRDGYRLA